MWRHRQSVTVCILEFRLQFILSIIVGGFALYGASVLINSLPVYFTHKRILAWARDPAMVKHFTGCANFYEWLKKLSDDAVGRSDVLLAIEASIAANQAPVGYVDNEKVSRPLRELGAKLRQSWMIHLSSEAARRAETGSNGM